MKSSDLSIKYGTLATTSELKTKPDKIVTLQAFNLNVSVVKDFLKMISNYLVFQGDNKFWKRLLLKLQRGLPDESINLPSTFDNGLPISLNFINIKLAVNLIKFTKPNFSWGL